LSDSCDDDECETKTVSTKKKRKGSRKSRQIESNSEPISGKFLKQNCVWSDGTLRYDPDSIHSFTGNVALNENITGLVIPLQFFRYFFNDEIIESIADQTALYSVQ